MRTGPFGSNLLHGEFKETGDVAVLGIDNAVNNKFVWKEKRFITFKKYENLKAYTIRPLDVIITIMGTVGRTAVIPENIPLSINTKHLAAISFDPQKANPYFIAYSMHSNQHIISQLFGVKRGAIMHGLNLGIIKKVKTKCPPIELQNKFAKILNKTENMKSYCETDQSLMNVFFNSLSQRMFK
jgi:type I restriction enzyme S subunit